MIKKKELLIVCILFVIIILLSIFKLYVCPFKFFLGLSCPTCGITRAIISAIHLNFYDSFHYHLLWPIIIIAIIIFILNELNITHIKRKNLLIFMYIVCFINIVYYFYRLFNGSDIVYFDFAESYLYKLFN